MEAIKYLEENYKFFIAKNKKSENHLYNNIRENILLTCFQNYKNVSFIPTIGKDIFDGLSNSLESYGIEKICDVKHIGNRSNTDFTIKYLQNGSEKTIDLEFKNGANKVDKLPQFLQLYTTNTEVSLIKNIQHYHQYYYENYLDQILNLVTNIKLEKPNYETYIKDLNTTDKKCFHLDLYEQYKKNKISFNKIVKNL